MDPFLTNIISLISALVGGGVAGGFTLWGVILSHRKEIDRREEEQRKLVNAFVQSVRVEIEVLWGRYNDSAGLHLTTLEEGRAFEMFYPVGHDYFTVYNTSCTLIGNIDDPALRASIVRTYTLGKALLDTYLFNNETLRSLQKLVLLFEETKNPVYRDHVTATVRVMENVAESLRDIHGQVERSVGETLRLASLYCGESPGVN